MFKFLKIMVKVILCLSTVIVPVIQALVTGLDNYNNRGNAYAAM